MNTYAFVAKPKYEGPFLFAIAPALSNETLADGLSSAAVRSIRPMSDGSYEVDVSVDSESHAAALNQIADIVEPLGYWIVEAIVREWVTRAFEGAVVGASGGGVVGTASQDGPAVLLGAVIGGITGAALGSLIPKVKVTYRAHRTWLYSRDWTLIATEEGQGHVGIAAA